MTSLREKMIDAILEVDDYESNASKFTYGRMADAILALPEIRDALRLLEEHHEEGLSGGD